MFRFVQHKPARLPALQQRSTFIQDPLVRPEIQIALMFLCKYLIGINEVKLRNSIRFTGQISGGKTDNSYSHKKLPNISSLALGHNYTLNLGENRQSLQI